MRRFSGTWMLWGLMLLGGAATHAQTAQPTPVITASVRLVVLDAVVTDSQGKVVEGLTAKDFQVLEEGVPQRIRSVDPPSAHRLPASSEAPGTVFDPAQPASFGDAPVTILVLDQLNTHFMDSSFARRQVSQYLARQPAQMTQPTALLTVYEGHFKVLNGFTRDRSKLEQALAAEPNKYPWTLEVNGITVQGPYERLDLSLRALEQMAQSYGRIRGRKNLVWIGAGFPSVDPTTVDADTYNEVKDTIHHVTDLLLDARMTVYAVDPTSTLPGVTELTDASQMAFFLAAGDASAGGLDPFGTGDDFDRLGPLTGGRVIRGLNNVAEQIGHAVELGANFYTITFTPSSASEAAAGFRRIRVVCLRPGLTIESRNGYYVESAKPKQVLTNAAYDLTTAAESVVPLRALHVTVAAGALPQTYAVRVSAPDLTWQAESDGGSVASVYVMGVALDAKGRMMNHTLLGMKANAKPGAKLGDPAQAATFDFSMAPAAKAATLRFVVRDSGSGKIGTYDLPLGR